MESLQNKVALVTGGTPGIGKATARLFAQNDARVSVATRRVKEGEAIIKQISNEGGQAVFIICDFITTAGRDNCILPSKQ